MVTNKNKTPLIWKVLSKEFKSYLDFGIIKPSSGQLNGMIKIQKKPTILGFTKNIKSATEFDDELTPHKIRNFLRKVINKENKESNFEIIGPNEYQSSDCSSSDKKFCVIIIQNSSFSLDDFEEISFELQN